MKTIKHLTQLRPNVARILYLVDGKQIAFQTTGSREFKMVKAIANYEQKVPTVKEPVHAV